MVSNCPVPSSSLHLYSPSSGSGICSASAPEMEQRVHFFHRKCFTQFKHQLFLRLALWFMPIIPKLREAETGGSPQVQGHLICMTSSKTARLRGCNSVFQTTTTTTRHTCHHPTSSAMACFEISETARASSYPVNHLILRACPWNPK